MKDLISIPRVAKLHPSIREEVTAIIDEVEQTITNDEVIVRVVQGLRTFAEQDELYAQGRTKPGPKVTNAPGGLSNHNYALAVDLCWLWKQADGTYKYDEAKSWLTGPKFMKMVALFEKHEYDWGGGWKTLKDTPHFEKKTSLTIRQMLKKWESGETFTQDGQKYIKL